MLHRQCYYGVSIPSIVGRDRYTLAFATLVPGVSVTGPFFARQKYPAHLRSPGQRTPAPKWLPGWMLSNLFEPYYHGTLACRRPRRHLGLGAGDTVPHHIVLRLCKTALYSRKLTLTSSPALDTPGPPVSRPFPRPGVTSYIWAPDVSPDPPFSTNAFPPRRGSGQYTSTTADRPRSLAAKRIGLTPD